MAACITISEALERHDLSRPAEVELAVDVWKTPAYASSIQVKASAIERKLSIRHGSSS